MYDEEFLKKIKFFGLLKYDSTKVFSLVEFEVDLIHFKKDFFDENSEVYKHYENGRNSADFAFDKKLFDEAITGDKEAMKMLEERQEDFAYKNKKNELFG